ncbi:hypothetical protein [Vibrio sp. SCSIO 43137]|uniref:hypothetical protein n=1 Tax=Vibrio sp. SCSIO 43137 TaxID=3021011 RepID=UPI0023070AF8|nr:hypothetical protein [Vibrio sp. SCSIO 43137]WCE28347.1 hypothetical protein PK654_08110 [Vibrio sp. SCSIO 43137]
MRNNLLSAVKMVSIGLVIVLLYFAQSTIAKYEINNMPVDNSGFSDFYNYAKDKVISKQEGVILRKKSEEAVRYRLNKDLFEKKITFFHYFLLLPIGCISMFILGRRYKLDRNSYISSGIIYASLVIGFGYIQPLFISASFLLGAYYSQRKRIKEKDLSA